MKNTKKIMMSAVALLLVFAVGLMTGKSSSGSSVEEHLGHDLKAEKNDKGEVVWTCSMHPQIKLPKPGKCPLCGMTLIPLKKGGGAEGDELGERELRLSKYAQKLASVLVSPVEYRFPEGERELTGELVWDETRLATQAAWFGGRIDKLRIDYTGQYVKKGQIIAEIYSPELYSAAEEWRLAKASKDDLLLRSVKKRLQLLGLDEKEQKKLATIQSDRIEQRAKASGVVVKLNVQEGQYVRTGQTLMKLGSTRQLWVEIDVFEEDLPVVRLGQKVRLKTESLPGMEFHGKVEFIHPQLKRETRTVKVRLSVRNPKDILKPGMLVRAKLTEKSRRKKVLMIPETAALLTGKRAVVYVEKKPGTYEGREVKLGRIFNNYYEVLGGIWEGERVVTRGAFKIDATMQIEAKPSMMYPEGGGPAPMDHSKMAMGGGSSDKKQSAKMKGMDHSKMKMESKKGKMKGMAMTGKNKVWFEKLYSEYLALHKALASDKVNQASSSMKKIAAMLKKKPAALKAAHTDHVAMSLQNATKSGSLEDMRKEFISLSSWVIARMEESMFRSAKGAAVYFCPMAADGNGATWLQAGGEVANPFYGTAMIGCGEKRKVFSQPGGK